METELRMWTVDMTSPEAAVACSNCCELLFPVMTQTDSGDCNGIQHFERHPVYELTQGDQVQGVSSVLERIYRFGQLKDLNESEEDLVEYIIPLCSNCASILNQMDILHQEFDRLRGFQSYLSGKIQQVDDIIADRIADLKLQLIAKEQSNDNLESLPDDSEVVVKIESEEPSNTILDSGPWVVMKRLRPEEIPGERQAELEDTSSNFSSKDSDKDYFPDVDVESVFSEEESKIDVSCEDHSSIAKRRRTSYRIMNKSGVVMAASIQNPTITAGKKLQTEKRKTGESKSTAFKVISNEETNATPAKDKAKHTEKKRRRKKFSIVEFYRRKLVHPYPCQYCLSDFDLELNRVEHLQQDHCSKSHSVICPPCGKLFTSEQGKIIHQPRCGVIPPQYVMPPYICDECGTEYKRRDCLQSHKKHKHNKERPFPCDQCDYRAKTLTAITLHQTLMHTVSERIECPECHKLLKNKLTFEYHFKHLHTSEGKQKYKEALKRGCAKMREERRKTRVTTSVCSECNIDFQTVSRYNIHQSKVHATTKKWQCEQCGKGFNSSKVFQSHQKYVHTDERPFICDMCGMSFKSPKNLKSHIDRVHTEGGRLKFNAYNRENYKRKQKLALELSKAKELECPDGSHVDEGTVFDVPGSSATESILS